MSKATIIFADGSKQMAHNLDDGRFRWYERKVYHLEDVKQSHAKGIPIRDCSSPPSLETAIEWRKELLAIKTSINEAKYIMRLELRAPTKDGLYLMIALGETEKQLQSLSDYIKIQRVSLANRVDDIEGQRYKRRLQHENNALKSQVIRLQQILLEQFGITVSDDELQSL